MTAQTTESSPLIGSKARPKRGRSYDSSTRASTRTLCCNESDDDGLESDYRSVSDYGETLAEFPIVPTEIEPDLDIPAAYREELAFLMRSTIPVLGTYLLEYSLIMASVVSIGHISTHALAAITLGSMTANVSGFGVLQGLTAALDTMLPPAWTSSEPQLVGLWSQRMMFVAMLALVPMFAIWHNAESILLSLRQDPEVAKLAAIYLKWASLGLPAYAFNCISRRYFQCQGYFSIPTQIILVVAPVNIALNYLLVWGPEPFRLGFIGAPIATAISLNLMSFLSIIYGVFLIPRTAWSPLSTRIFSNLSVLVHLGLAGVGQSATEWWAWELAGLAASLFGPVTLAAQSVLIVTSSCTYQTAYALGVAASVRIGNLLGECKARRAAISSLTALMMGLVMAAVMSSMLVILRNSLGRLFNDDEEVITLVASILPLVALHQVLDFESAIAAGILRACGKQAISAICNIMGYCMLGIPIGILLAFTFNMQLYGIWIGLTAALVWEAACGVWFSVRLDWNAEIIKVVERLEGDKPKKPNGSQV